MNASLQLFDTKAISNHQSRALRMAQTDADFLLTEAAEILLDRLYDVTRNFSVAVDLGAHTGQLSELIRNHDRVDKLISVETHADLLARCPAPKVHAHEDNLPFSTESIDLVLSCMSIHWINNLPDLLIEIRRILKPGGLFLAILPGEETLIELRNSFAHAELETEGGISPRIAPMITIKDAALLLQRAGFIAPVSDKDRITVDYPDPIKLMHDLRAMGETNPTQSRRKTPLRRQTLLKMMEHYQSHHTNAAGRYTATFDLISMTAWKSE